MRRRKQNKPAVTGLAEPPRAFEPKPVRQSAELGAGGRLVIPAAMRAALGIKTGDRVILRLEGNELRVFTHKEALRRARDRVRRYLPKDTDILAEFLSGKRAEAAREQAEFNAGDKGG